VGDPPTPRAENPPLILFDTDVLFQIFIAQQIQLLRHLKQTYRIQPAVAESVDVEVRTNKKFRGQFSGMYQKALASETVLVVEQRTLPSFIATDARTIYNSIQTLGLQYNRFMDKGESYTHAAGVILRVPVASNDGSALLVAQRNGIQVYEPVLRMFDLVVLGRQIAFYSDSDCNKIRKELLNRNEGVPAAFKNCSFEDGLPNFYARIIDGFLQVIGAPGPLSKRDSRVTILAT
jgi:hypothetical protein